MIRSEIRGVTVQTLKSSKRTVAIIAQMPDAICPIFEAVAGCPLIFQMGIRKRIEDIFENEEGQTLAEALSTTSDTIWRIRKALGLALSYTGESATTKWRIKKRDQAIAIIL